MDEQIGRILHRLPAVICGTIVNIYSRYLIVPVYCAKIAKAMGYEVIKVRYPSMPIKKDLATMEEDCRIGLEHVDRVLDLEALRQYDEILFVSKSIGTLVGTEYAHQHGLPCRHILLTPVAQAIHAGDEYVAFHGTADDWVDVHDVKTKCTKTLHLYEGANHSLETGDLEKDLDILRDVIRKIKEYIVGRDAKMTKIVLVGDALDRGEYARSLYRIIGDYVPMIDEKTGKTKKENGKLVYEKPCNATDNDAFIMAISAPWGSGKSTFVKSLKKVLSLDGIEKGKDSFVDEKKLSSREVGIFDAWVNDFYDDPLVPFTRFLVETICRAEAEFQLSSMAIGRIPEAAGTIIKETVSEGAKEAAKETAKSPDSLEKVLAAGIVGAIGGLFKGGAKGIQSIRDAGDTDEYIESIVGEDDLEKGIQKLRNLVSDHVQNTPHKKIVLIIDELDRCKPTFAVKMLEIVKHLFNVPGIVFVFSLDITELQHCVKVVYGKDFDAIGYLERFFDYSTLLPRGNRKTLFESIAEEFKILDKIELLDDYYEICNGFRLSPREMRAVCASFFYLKKYGLEGYPLNALRLYFYLLVLKYKYPVEVMKYIATSEMAEERTKFYMEHLPVFTPYKVTGDDSFSMVFRENKRIKDCEGLRKIYANGQPDDYSTYGLKDSAPSLDHEESLSFALYAKDLANLNKIRDQLILEYLFNKVELYNTALHWNDQISGTDIYSRSA